MSEQAEETADPAERMRLFNRAIAEERELLTLQQHLGQPAQIAPSHNNLAEYLRLAGQLDEAEQQALAAIQQNDPWLATHLEALATGNPQPNAAVPNQYQDLIHQAWSAAGR